MVPSAHRTYLVSCGNVLSRSPCQSCVGMAEHRCPPRGAAPGQQLSRDAKTLTLKNLQTCISKHLLLHILGHP